MVKVSDRNASRRRRAASLLHTASSDRWIRFSVLLAVVGLALFASSSLLPLHYIFSVGTGTLSASLVTGETGVLYFSETTGYSTLISITTNGTQMFDYSIYNYAYVQVNGVVKYTQSRVAAGTVQGPHAFLSFPEADVDASYFANFTLVSGGAARLHANATVRTDGLIPVALPLEISGVLLSVSGAGLFAARISMIDWSNSYGRKEIRR